MDKKYAGGAVVLPLDVAKALDELRGRLMRELGFEPSRSEAVAYLMNFYEKNKGSPVIHASNCACSECTMPELRGGQ